MTLKLYQCADCRRLQTLCDRHEAEAVARAERWAKVQASIDDLLADERFCLIGKKAASK